jgi:predicted aconitase with swiveling domain
MFAGETKTAPCTDSANKELYEKDLKGAMICTPQTVGSTMGAGTVMMLSELGVQPQAWLFSSHIDSISAAGLIIDDVWNERRVITIDLLGDEFLEATKTGDPITIHEDGTVEVG